MRNTSQLQQAFYTGIQGCHVEISGSGPPPEVLITPGLVRDHTNSFDIELTSNYTLNLSNAGVGGIGDGTLLSPNQDYGIFVIGSSRECGGNQPAIGKAVALRFTQFFSPNYPYLVPYNTVLSDKDGTYDIGRLVGWAFALSFDTLARSTSHGGPLRTTVYDEGVELFPPKTGPILDPLRFLLPASARIPPLAVEILASWRLVNAAPGIEIASGELWGNNADGASWVSLNTAGEEAVFVGALPAVGDPIRYAVTANSATTTWEAKAFGYRFQV